MIQRLQSIYFLLSALSIALLFFFPIAWFYGEFHILTFYIHRLVDHMPSAEPLFTSGFLYLPLGMTLVLIVLPIYILFKFRKLELQLRLARIHMMFLLVLVALLFFYYVDTIASKVGSPADYAFGVFSPLLALVFNYLAQRGITSDIKLIRSADRIR